VLDEIEADYKNRCIPYIQLHEFEGLLFNEIQVFLNQIPPDELIGLKELKDIFKHFSNPELINNSKKNAPSQRLERIIKGYNKVVYGNILAEAIGLEKIRSKSPRFNEWISKIEQL
jgi:hypothetical protein